MKPKFIAFLLSGFLLVLASCEDSDNTTIDPTDNLVHIGTENDNGITLDLYSDAELHVGLNTLYFQLTDDNLGVNITEARITQQPVMNMDGMKHSCPVTDPDVMANADGLFTGEVVFIMASGMMGTWDDTLVVINESSGQTHKLVFSGLTVTETMMKKDLVFFDADSNQTSYIVTLNGLENPQAGTNDIILTVHHKESMMNIPEVGGLDIVMNPLMPDMGHGSTGNINPVYDGNGQYSGVVIFNMTGYWTIDFTFAENGDTLGTVQYEINF